MRLATFLKKKNWFYVCLSLSLFVVLLEARALCFAYSHSISDPVHPAPPPRALTHTAYRQSRSLHVSAGPTNWFLSPGPDRFSLQRRRPVIFLYRSAEDRGQIGFSSPTEPLELANLSWRCSWGGGLNLHDLNYLKQRLKLSVRGDLQVPTSPQKKSFFISFHWRAMTGMLSASLVIVVRSASLYGPELEYINARISNTRKDSNHRSWFTNLV